MLKYVLPVLALAFASPAIAAETKEFTIVLKNHMFSPDVLLLPVNTPAKITVKNEDPTPAEFESHDLKREKIIKGNSSAVIMIPGLQVGEYKFFDEFNEKTAHGKVIVRSEF